VHRNIVGKEYSPNPVKVEVIAEMNCGATTQFATIVGVLPADRLGIIGSEYFIATKGRDDLKLRWIGDERLVVVALPNAEITRKASVWGQIEIGYE